MPNDAKGRDLKPGDIVVVPFTVKAVHLSGASRNLDLETCASMPPEHLEKTRFANINAQMVLRANKGDDTTFHLVATGAGEFRLMENK